MLPARRLLAVIAEQVAGLAGIPRALILNFSDEREMPTGLYRICDGKSPHVAGLRHQSPETCPNLGSARLSKEMPEDHALMLPGRHLWNGQPNRLRPRSAASGTAGCRQVVAERVAGVGGDNE
jgi:hypothetical protein